MTKPDEERAGTARTRPNSEADEIKCFNEVIFLRTSREGAKSGFAKIFTVSIVLHKSLEEI